MVINSLIPAAFAGEITIIVMVGNRGNFMIFFPAAGADGYLLISVEVIIMLFVSSLYIPVKFVEVELCTDL